MLLLLLHAAAGSLAAQGDPTPPKRCFKCLGAGFVPCTARECKPAVCKLSLPHKCDRVFAAKCCHGTQKVVCPGCRSVEAQALIDGEVAERLAWLASQETVVRTIKGKIHAIETDHFMVYSAIPKVKIGDVSYDRDQSAHIYAQRIEDACSAFMTLLGVTDAAFRGRHTIYLVADSGQCLRATMNYMGGGQANGFKLYSTAGKFAVWPDRNRYATEEEFHQHVYHNAVHLLNHAAYGFQQDFDYWVDVGLAHWLEADKFGDSRTYCFRETPAKSTWETSNWRKKIYGLVSSAKERPMARVAACRLSDMDHEDHAMAWSYVDYLVMEHREAFRTFFQALKRTKNDYKAAMMETFGFTTATFHQKWREYVLKKYGGVQ